MGSLLQSLAKTGWKKGLREGNRTWLYVGVAATGMRLVRKMLVQEPQTVYRTELKPGDRFEIRAVAPDA